MLEGIFIYSVISSEIWLEKWNFIFLFFLLLSISTINLVRRICSVNEKACKISYYYLKIYLITNSLESLSIYMFLRSLISLLT